MWAAHGFLPCPGGEASPLPRRCWVKAQTLLLEMKATLAADHGKGVPDGSKDPAGEELEKTLNNVSSRVRQADEQGSPVTGTAMFNLLANHSIIPGGCADEATIEAAQVWATVEDQEDAVEAMRLDVVNEMTAQLEGIVAWGAWTPLMTIRRTATMR